MKISTTMYVYRFFLFALLAAAVAVPAYRVGVEDGKHQEASRSFGNEQDCAHKVLSRLIDRAETEKDRLVLASFVNETCSIAADNKTRF
jgi:hypothetical protein